MAVTEDRLIAYAEGQLPPAEADAMKSAIAADPALAAQLADHQALRRRLSAAYDPALQEAPRPEWIDLIAAAGVSKLAAERGRRRPLANWRVWGGMAACLAAGLFAGRLLPPQDPRLITSTPAGLVAQGDLDRALTHQLASAPSDGTVRIGVSFQSHDRRLCRTFQARQGMAGLACREGEVWNVRVAIATPPVAAGGYRTAASAPPAVLDAMDSMIQGDPLDAQAEVAAQRKNWRP